MRWVFETDVDLGDFGTRAAIICADVKVDRYERTEYPGQDEVEVRIVSLEVYFPGKLGEADKWDEEHRLVDFTDFLRSPKGLMIKQRIETWLEDNHYQEILDHFKDMHLPDRHEDAV